MTVDNNAKTIHGDKKPDMSLVPPVAILSEARVMQLGASKYGPYNWRDKTVSARVYTAAAMRHILQWQDGEDIDPESGESHLAHARACLGIIIDAQSIGKFNDNRPTKGAASDSIRRVSEAAAALDSVSDDAIYRAMEPRCSVCED